MLKAVITYLNLKLGLLNYFDLTRCLSELKVDSEGKTSPKEYISNGNWDNIDFDAKDGVSYWRLRDEITTSPIESVYKAGKRVEVTIPLKLVFSVPRRKLTEDDAYSFDRIRQTISKQFNIDDGDLKNTLGCEKVEISSPTANGDAKEVWDAETENTGTHEPNYDVVFGSVDIDVKLIYKGSCLPTECEDVDSDILHSFDFCSAAIRDRLTDAQVTCLEDALCGVCADATYTNSDGSYSGSVSSGGALNIPDITVTDSDGSTSSVPSVQDIVCTPSPDATVENSDASYSTTVASGGTLVVPDTAISANGDLVVNQPSTIAKDITVRYDTQGTVATTISGGEIVVPDVAAVPSLTIGVFSDAGYTTPVTGGAFGDTVYIKLYESNITPTGFTISFNGGSDKVINQAGGTYTWVIDVKGTVTINASARDGSDGVANATAFTFTTTNAYVGGKELSLDGVADTADGCINGFQIMQNYGLSFMIRKPSGLSASYRGVIGFGSCLAGSTIQRTYNGIVVNHWVQSISYAATFNGQVFNASLSLDLDQDQHWRYEVGETHLRVYKDGVEVYSTARTTALPIISGEISVGISRNTATKPSQMFIRDVFIDDGTLSAAESLALSNASHAGTDPTAAAATKFIEGWDFGRVSTGVPSTNTASPTIAYGMLKNSELVMATTFTSPNGILDL
jgi:hypothetical protein